MKELLQADRRHAWHPFTQHATERDPIVIVRARGASLFDAEDREILDLISSWWTNIHGHAHPALNQALADQADTMEHVMFAGFTHPPAAQLAERLSAVLPGDLGRVFFSDNGSTAVEVALKLAYQYWRNRGETGRSGFFAFEGGYHGDTVGAMSVGRGSGFFSLFEDLMCTVHPLPYAPTWRGDNAVEERETQALAAFAAALDAHGHETAAVIMEPLMQGAGGMRFCRPQFVRRIVELARDAGLLVIFDEVATGFGRTGTLFAMEQADVVPDIVCLSKGLTAGYMPMSVTVAREPIYEAFLDASFDKALAHGHSFTANALACSVALRSLDLFEEEGTLARVARIADAHEAVLERLGAHARVSQPRALGSVLAFELTDSVGSYKTAEGEALRDWFLNAGLNIRPLGPTVYLMPPYCISDEQLARAYGGLLEGLDRL
ncbi:MAG: adenosylmethionine--8-amino-7-oxononanoate transaminase [Methyloligellaceae bacterium]